MDPYGFGNMQGFNSAPPVIDQVQIPDQMMPQQGSNMMMGQQQQQWQQQQQQWQQQQQQQQSQADAMMMQHGGVAQMPQQQMDLQYAQAQSMQQMGMSGDMMGQGMMMTAGMHPGAGQFAGEDKPINKTTVYVGGLPIAGSSEGGEPVDEAALHNFFFSNCGAIKSIRMQANKGFCFVEFENEASAHAATLLTGTHAALRPELPNVTTRLMVRYAYERPMRKPPAQQHMQQLLPQAMLQNGGFDGGYMLGPSGGGSGQWGPGPAGLWEGPAFQGGAMLPLESPPMWAGGQDERGPWQPEAPRPVPSRRERERFGPSRQHPHRERSPSPPRVPLYTDAENRKMKDLLKQSVEEIEGLAPGRGPQLLGAPGHGGNLLHAINTVQSWMESGECGKKTADNFYVYLQNISAKLAELQQADDQRTKARKAEDVAHYNQMFAKFEAALAAFSEAQKQKVKDSFSKVQRKNVDRWVTSASDALEKCRLLLRNQAGVSGLGAEEDMELEPEGKAALAPPAPPPAALPAPQGVAAGLLATPAMPPPPPSASIKEAEDAHRAKKLKSEEGAGDDDPVKERYMDALTSRINSLEQMLMQRLTAPGASPPPAKADPVAVCILASLAVHLASYPQGAKRSQLHAYVHMLCSASTGSVQQQGAGSLGDGEVERVVQAALLMAPGVFTETASEDGDPVWSLTALQALPHLVASRQ